MEIKICEFVAKTQFLNTILVVQSRDLAASSFSFEIMYKNEKSIFVQLDIRN